MMEWMVEMDGDGRSRLRLAGSWTEIVLRYLQDLPENEIATLLGCRPGTVKSSLSVGWPPLERRSPDDRQR
jgi:hypothetical protein